MDDRARRYRTKPPEERERERETKIAPASPPFFTHQKPFLGPSPFSSMERVWPGGQTKASGNEDEIQCGEGGSTNEKEREREPLLPALH